MFLEELDYAKQTMIRDAINRIPGGSAYGKWRIHRIERGTDESMYIVELQQDQYVLRGVIFLYHIALLLLDASSNYLLASTYSQQMLEQYNAGHDPHYRGM